MPSNKVYLFGDQAADVLPTIQHLSTLVSRSHNLACFFRRATDRLQRVLASAGMVYSRPSLSFDSPLELATIVEAGYKYDPALRAAILSICQIGSVIIHLETQPEALEGYEVQPVLLGICTGLLAAAAVSCCRNITELLRVADEVVQLSFQVGLAATRRSGYIESSTQSWAILLSGIASEDARQTIDTFNAECALEPTHHAYISAQSATSMTISGPPSTLSSLFSQSAFFQRMRKVPLPISAAFHASHLRPVPYPTLCQGISSTLLEAHVRHRTLISPCSGEPYACTIFADLLRGVAHDILQEPVCFETTIKSLSLSLEFKTTLFRMGPVTSIKGIQDSLALHGIELNDIQNSQPDAYFERSDDDAIAIVGMSVRLPGSETLEEFWQTLEEGRDLHEKIRPDRFDVATHFDSSGSTRNTTLTPYGVFIDRPGYFDTRMFNMSPREAAQTDPQQRLTLLATYEALEMAGYRPNRTPSTSLRRIGSFIGQTSDDYREVNASQNIDTYFITGGIRAFGPGRLNYHFGWEGPSYSVDTACSSSAAAIQLACSALLSRECDMAVGGGANFLTASDLFAGLSRGSFLSKTGGCKTFDHDADGYVRADAVGIVLLKRMVDALADRDNVYAVLKGATTNHSADAVSITHPHGPTQERLFNTVLGKAGLHPHDIDYVEMHGTGTQAGDATESKSVTNVLAQGRKSPLYIGSVKPNLGHGEAASGVTSLIKAIMMLRKGVIPPHVGIKGRINQRLPPFSELNTHISFDKTPFTPRRNGDGKRRILINNFDAAGGNTSMIIEDAPGLQTATKDPRGHHIVTISGRTSNAILNNCKRLLEFIGSNPETQLEDIAYTTTARRIHYSLRQAHSVSSLGGLAAALRNTITRENWGKAPSSQPSVTFLFTGQGSPCLSMASELYNTHQPFRQSVLDCDGICLSHGFESFIPLITDRSFDLSHATPAQIQLAIVSTELAVVALWKSIGVLPGAVLGHSLGEYPALCTAGVISLSDCLYLVGTRAKLMENRCSQVSHSMLAIQESLETIKALSKELGGLGCDVACVNSPRSTVVSGSVKQIQNFQDKLHLQGIKATVLEVPFAFHSSQMDTLLEEFELVAAKVQFHTPSIPIASTLLGQVVTSKGVVDANYLTRQTRMPVEFIQGLRNLSAALKPDSPRLWIEVGPNPVCLGFVRDYLGENEILLPSLKRGESDWKIFSSSVARAYTAGVDIDWTQFHHHYEMSLRLLELPHYAFDLKNHWIQYEGDWTIRKGGVSQKTGRTTPGFSTTSLQCIESETSDADGITVTFSSNTSEPKLNKVLRGHLVNGVGLCPSSVYADMAFTAASYIQGLSAPATGLSMDIRDMEVHKPLIIQPNDIKQKILVTASKRSSSHVIDVQFRSEDGTTHYDHAHCVVALGDGSQWKSEWARSSYLVKARMDHLVATSLKGKTHRILRPMVYKLFAALVDYDPKYQGLEEVYMDSNLHEATANVKLRGDHSDGSFTISPYWIDSFTHLSGFVLNGADSTPADSVFISHGWGSMKIVGQLSAENNYQSYVRVQKTESPGVFAGDVYFFENNEVIALCQNLKFQRVKKTTLNYLLPRDSTNSTLARKAASSQATATAISPTTAPRLGKSQVREVIPAPVPSAFRNILEVIASEIGVDPAELNNDVLFGDLGVDSLLSISIIAKINDLVEVRVPSTLFDDCASVGDLKAYFSKQNSGVSTESMSSSDYQPTGSDSTTMTTPELTPNLSDGCDINEIKKIIAQEAGINVNEIDHTTPLTEYGIDSLLSLVVLGAIGAKIGKNLPAGFLNDNPTLANIHSALDESPPKTTLPIRSPRRHQVDSGAIEAEAEAVLLQNSTDSQEPALFLLPDGSGSAGSYIQLRELKTTGPVYGLNSPYLSCTSSFNAPLRVVAAMYVRAIRRMQPCGPYRLGGWSIGGVYAFEVASQLTQDHDEVVDALILIDSPCPTKLPPLLPETIELLDKVGAFDSLKSKPDGVFTQGSGISEGMAAHFRGSVNALTNYQARPIPADRAPRSVGIIWAKSGVWETVGELVRSRHQGENTHQGKNLTADWILDPRTSYGANGWESLLPGVDLACATVTGNHFTMMRRPGVIELGELLRRTICDLD